MDSTQIVTANELEDFADRRDSQGAIPELIWLLITQSCLDLALCNIAYGDAVNQPGYDGIVETPGGFRHFVPKQKSYWEIGTGRDPQDKATQDYNKRTDSTSLDERQKTSYIVVTPRGGKAGGWDQPSQQKWLEARKNDGWRSISILDGNRIADWLREFPGIGKWLLKRMGLVKSISGFSTPAEHWENLQQMVHQGDPPLPPKVFFSWQGCCL
jgi:hypothetical protein